MKYEIRLHARPVWDLDAKSTVLGKLRKAVKVIDAESDREAVRAARPVMATTQISATALSEPHPDGPPGRLILRFPGHGTASIHSWMTKRGLMVLVPAATPAESETEADLIVHAEDIGRGQAEALAGARAGASGTWPPEPIPPVPPFDAIAHARPLLEDDATEADINVLAGILNDAAKERWDELALIKSAAAASKAQ